VTAAVLLLVVSVERAGHGSAGVTALTVAAGLLLFLAFVLIERKAAAPLVRLGIFRSGSLVRSNLAGLLFAAGFFGFQFVVVLYLRELRGWSTLETSFAMLVIGVDAILSPTLTPKLVGRFGNARVIFGGLLLATLSYALMLPLGLDWTYLMMFPSLILLGLAFSLAYGPLTIVATEGVAEEEQGVAGGLLYTSFQFGAALGLSAATTVITAATDGTSEQGLLVPLIAAALATVISAFGLRGKPGTAATEPVPAHDAVPAHDPALESTDSAR
jgi:predicted MFS family arabinose efflux permease